MTAPENGAGRAGTGPIPNANRELIERCEKYDRRHAFRRPSANHLEAVDLRHLDVEKEHIGAKRVESGEYFSPVAAFADYRELGIWAEQLPHPSARSWLIVRNEHAPSSRCHRTRSLAVARAREFGDTPWRPAVAQERLRAMRARRRACEKAGRLIKLTRAEKIPSFSRAYRTQAERLRVVPDKSYRESASTPTLARDMLTRRVHRISS